jgi:predicted phosphoribosyltransferase
MISRFTDRREAGHLLAARLAHYANRSDVLVLALPRGGVPVGYELARELHAPLDVLLVRKLGLPGQEELAMGAIATGGVRLINQSLIAAAGITQEEVRAVDEREQRELRRRELAYRGNHPLIPVADKTVILVDDGIATGSTMQAAITSLRQRQVHRLIVATPVAPPSVAERLERLAEEVVCILTPENFGGVGQWYDDFSQTSDEEVHRLLTSAASSMTKPLQFTHPP